MKSKLSTSYLQYHFNSDLYFIQFQTFQPVFHSNFPKNLEICQATWKLSRQTGNFPDNLETFQTTWKLARQPGNYPNNLETFQTNLKLFRQSVIIPDKLETFQITWWWKLSCDESYLVIQIIAWWQLFRHAVREVTICMGQVRQVIFFRLDNYL